MVLPMFIAIEKKESNRSIDFGQLIGGISLARQKRELKDQ